MPRIRRRTLSHNEIENFLSEISAVENQDGPIKPGSIKNEQSLTDEEEDTVVTEEICNEIKDEAQHIRDFCKVQQILTFSLLLF